MDARLRRALTLALVAACSSEPVMRSPTQITLRLHASVEAQLRGARLRLEVDGKNALGGDRPLAEIPSWPVDVPIVRDDARAARVELVAEVLADDGSAIAQDRAVTEFVAHEPRVLELYLGACTSAEPVCEAGDCQGESCRHCVEGQCVAVGFTSGASLSVLDEHATIAPDEVPSCPDVPLRCDGKVLERCDAGRWSLSEVCEHVCLQNACAGECTPGEDRDRCTASRAVEHCGAEGRWEANRAAMQDRQTCPYLCVDGACVGECSAGSARCVAGGPEVCGASARWEARAPCDEFCAGTACASAPSCTGRLRCGSNESCCRAPWVPGGAFLRSYDAVTNLDTAARATVGALTLDAFEVTVGRFRSWLRVYDEPLARPRAGDGKNARDPADMGWDAAWSASLPATRAVLLEQLAACDGATFTALPGSDDAERLPINCVSWYLAQAFCIWDGGRLPTEAEWNFAAAGGAEQRVYPWSRPPSDPTIDAEYAVYDTTALARVGSKPKGRGRFGHADLAGNVAEWVADWVADPYPSGPCSDCAVHKASTRRRHRGGSFELTEDGVTSSTRDGLNPTWSDKNVGLRCAR